MSTETTAGRRERNRLRTHQAIADAALELFAERGFEATTITDITERADVSRRTFFSYFPSKEDVVFADFPVMLEAFEAHLGTRGPDETVFDSLRSWLPELAAAKREPDAQALCRRRLIDGTPQLESALHARQAEFVELIAAEAARDLGVGRDDLRAQLVGSAATTALGIVDRHRRDHHEAPELLERAITFLEGGLDALRRAG